LKAIVELNAYVARERADFQDALTDPSNKLLIRRAKDRLEDAISERIQFWQDTCRFEALGTYEADAYALYSEFGHNFRVQRRPKFPQSWKYWIDDCPDGMRRA
jgi:hypothetical protein